MKVGLRPRPLPLLTDTALANEDCGVTAAVDLGVAFEVLDGEFLGESASRSTDKASSSDASSSIDV